MRTYSSLALLILLLSTRASAVTFDEAMDTLYQQGYTQGLVSYFCAQGTNPDLGFRWAGTSAERAVGRRVAEEMRSMGLNNVRLEPVPVDVFEFKKASLTVGDQIIVASTIAGVPPTPKGGITAEVLYVKSGTAADFDAVGDVSGKLVLIDSRMSSWWYHMPAFEAGLRKAAGVIATSSAEDPKYYSGSDDALGSFDGIYDLGAPPWIYVSRRTGDHLKSLLKSGRVIATMLLDQDVTLARDGGVAYNVIGELLGKRRDGQRILLTAHQDAHFRAGIDDASGLANLLTVAKALCLSKYDPSHTITFLATAAEEFGHTGAYYDFCIGAWWAATRAHKDWAGRVRAMLNLEGMGMAGVPVYLQCNPELEPWLKSLTHQSVPGFTWGTVIKTPVHSWNDQWTFTAAGIPSVKIDTIGENEDYNKVYHSNLETAALVDWSYLGNIGKFVFRAVQQLDTGLLPFSLKARADELTNAVKREDLLAVGADEKAVRDLIAQISAFQSAAATFDARVQEIPSSRIPDMNKRLLTLEMILNRSFTALSADDATIYPHEQVLRDARGLSLALTALTRVPTDAPAAMNALGSTYVTSLGTNFSHAAYLKHLSRLDPKFERIAWGGQGHLPKPLDVIPQYRIDPGGEVSESCHWPVIASKTARP
ncbi:MAG: M28 family peptidase [Verrucomicrobiia bacterium]